MTLVPSANSMRTSVSMMVTRSPSMAIVPPVSPESPQATTPLVTMDPGSSTSEGMSGTTQCAGRTGNMAGGGPSTAGTRQMMENVPGASSFSPR